MSHYTNDTDTLRQFISNALAQLIACLITALASFIVMICYSRALALIVIAVTVIDVFITLIVSRKSVRCFSGQQTSMAAMNGYIEEMLNGQKVIKIFCHEKQSKNGFQEKNTALFESSRSANTLANLIMPVLGQIGNLLTVSDRVHRGNPDPERKHRAHRRHCRGILVSVKILCQSDPAGRTADQPDHDGNGRRQAYFCPSGRRTGI